MASLRELLWYQVIRKFPEWVFPISTRHGRLYINNKDQVISRELFLTGEFEYSKINTVLYLLKNLSLLKSNGVLLDIGANIGTVCIPLIKENYFLSAFAFEPEPKNYKSLMKGIKNNKLNKRILPFNLALSNRNGELNLAVSEDNFGDHKIQVSTQGSAKTVKIQSTTLDHFLSSHQINPGNISLIWMDVQGHEKHVLEGCSDLLLNYSIPTVIEFWPHGLNNAKVKPEEFVQMIQKYFKFYYDLSDSTLTKKSVTNLIELYNKYQDQKFTDLLLLKN